MKRMHLQLLKKANCVLASLLMLLGFSCTDDEGEGPIICEYGTPYANFQIKGKVVDTNIIRYLTPKYVSIEMTQEFILTDGCIPIP